MKTFAIATAIIVAASPAFARNPYTPLIGKPDQQHSSVVYTLDSRWMLLNISKESGVSIKLGLTRQECVAVLWAMNPNKNPSTQRYLWQSPDPYCETQGLKTIPSLFGTTCQPQNITLGFSGGPWSVISPLSVITGGTVRDEGTCVNSTTGDTTNVMTEDGPTTWWPAL
jgi:hypothetical protein